jgi:two-component system chemotaxis response regulator CheY
VLLGLYSLSAVRNGLLSLVLHVFEVSRRLNFARHSADEPVETAMTATAPVSVLIVDDSAAIRKILHRILLQTGLPFGEIQEASDGREAATILKDRSFGLILSDINMPRMDGLQLLGEIREMEHLKNVPVVMVTTEGEQAREAVRRGAAGYILKPFSAEQIKEKLTRLM